MAKLPSPPSQAVLAGIGSDLLALPAGTRIWRVYMQGGTHPTTWERFRTFGPTDARFDHHRPPAHIQGRAVLYGATGPRAATTTIAEVFQATRVVHRERRAPAWVAFDVTRELRLLDLTGSWPTRAGASMAINSGPRSRARAWARVMYDAFPGLDGLLYSSSMHANQPCPVLWERARNALPARPTFHRQLADPAVLTLLKNACHEVGYTLA